MLENEKIKDIRIQLDLTQQEMADSLGVSKQYLSKVEKGHTDLSKEKIVQLCSNYNVSLDWLLLDKGEAFLKDSNIAENSGNILAKEVEDVFKFDVALKLYSLFVNESFSIIKNKYPQAQVDDIIEAARQLFDIDNSFYDDIDKFQLDLNEFKNKGRKYILFKERILTAYSRVCKTREIENNSNTPKQSSNVRIS